jgi:hypothetical protein
VTTAGVVVLSPLLDNDLRLLKAVENLSVYKWLVRAKLDDNPFFERLGTLKVIPHEE